MVVACVVLGLSIWAFVTRCNTDKFGSCGYAVPVINGDIKKACSDFQKPSCSEGSIIDCDLHNTICKMSAIDYDSGIDPSRKENNKRIKWVLSKGSVPLKGQSDLTECPSTPLPCVNPPEACGESTSDNRECCQGSTCTYNGLDAMVKYTCQ